MVARNLDCNPPLSVSDRDSRFNQTMAGYTDESDLTQNLRDRFLQCRICLEGLKEPKTLPCLHTFCARCVACYVDYNRIDNRKFACPICRRHIYIPKDGIGAFPDSFFVQSLNDVLAHSAAVTGAQAARPKECGICRFKEGTVEAKVMCVECKVELCGDCTNSHNEAKVTMGHTLLQLRPSQHSIGTGRENYCRVHKGEVVKYYCETCNSPICLPCTFLDHSGHRIEEIKTVRQGFVEDMEKLVTKSEDNIIQLQAARDDLAELENELFVRKEMIKTQVRRAVKSCLRAVHEQESRILDEIDSFYDIVSVAADRHEVDKTIFRLQHAHDFARDLLSSETSPITQLVNRVEAKRNLERAQEYELPDITHHAEKMNRYMCYMPGNMDPCVGSVIRCAGETSTNTMLLRPACLPTDRAIFLHRCRPPRGQTIGEVAAVDFLPSGDIVMLTTVKKYIKVFSAKGWKKFEFADEDDLLLPTDMAVTRDGELAVTDAGALCVKIFDLFGVAKMTFGDREIFEFPVAICIDFIGRFIVCDQAKHQLLVHRQHGELLQALDVGEISTPEDVCTFGNKIYISDVINGVVCVYAYCEDGIEFVAKIEAGGVFLDCSGICVDRFGDLLISDAVLGRVHIVNGNMEISCVVSRGSQFLRPKCLAVSIDGFLAVSQLVDLGVESEAIGEEGDDVARSSGDEVRMETEIYIYRLMKSD